VAWLSYRMLTKASNTIYVLASGKAMEATAGDRRENIPVEARDHIRNFHQLFFTLDPDEKVIEANLGKALYLADVSAKRLYDNLKENGYYAGIIAGNISQEAAIDSIVLDARPYPMYFRCYAKEKIIRPTSIVTRNLITEGWLRTTGRSDNNPHGFLIERWVIIDNRDLKVEER
jgi:conjugative transposon TraK protein